ncbi:MAG: monovalent cation/H+ antiporter complex subunit F [Bacteroidales bacterium]
MKEAFDVVHTGSLIVLGILTLALALAFWRLLKGPSLPDRLLALDFIATLAVGVIFALVFLSGKTVYLDIAVFIALIVFLGTVAVSKFLKRRFYDK